MSMCGNRGQRSPVHERGSRTSTAASSGRAPSVFTTAARGLAIKLAAGRPSTRHTVETAIVRRPAVERWLADLPARGRARQNATTAHRSTTAISQGFTATLPKQPQDAAPRTPRYEETHARPAKQIIAAKRVCRGTKPERSQTANTNSNSTSAIKSQRAVIRLVSAVGVVAS